LLRALDQRVSYLNVDADGTVEIWSSSGYMAGNREAWALSIFDSTGRELTRAAGDCQIAVGAQGEEATTYLPAACPYAGRPDVEHALDSDGKIVLKAVTDFPYETQEDRTYKFVTGRYVRRQENKIQTLDFPQICGRTEGNRLGRFQVQSSRLPGSGRQSLTCALAMMRPNQWNLVVVQIRFPQPQVCF